MVDLTRTRHCSPAKQAGDLDVAGPAWLRSYPDRGGPVHQKRRENLMRRASTCLAVLGFALLALPGVASAAPTVTLKAKPSDPEVQRGLLPGTGNIYGAGAAAAGRIHDHRDRIRRRILRRRPSRSADRGHFFLPKGSKLHTKRLQDLPGKDAGSRKGARKVPEGLGRESHQLEGPSLGPLLGRRFLRQTGGSKRKSKCSRSSCRSGLEFLIFGHHPATFEIRPPATTSTSTAPAASAPSSSPKCR